MRTSTSAIERAMVKIKANGGLIRTKKAVASRVYSRTLANLVEQGKVEKLSRGVYRIVKANNAVDQDLVTVAATVPRGIICLISALAFHKITTQIPRSIDIALPRTVRTPSLDYPPTTVYRFAPEAYSHGIEKHTIDGVIVRIYNIEKTLADCFKFRNRIGMDIVLEALKFYRSRKNFNINRLMHYARICRIEKQIIPYLEAIA